MERFRAKKKVGQFHVNIPGVGSTSVEAFPDNPACLNPALIAAKEAFWKAYREIEQRDKAEAPNADR